MPVKKRKSKVINDYPQPWEEHPVSFERWQRHRERMMEHARAGRRPQEWWAYEAPIPWPGYDNETVTLYKAGLLSEEEIAELMPRWREWYEQAQDPSFSYCGGPDKWLKGAEARRAHYKWACIPPDIVKQWDRERGATS